MSNASLFRTGRPLSRMYKTVHRPCATSRMHLAGPLGSLPLPFTMTQNKASSTGAPGHKRLDISNINPSVLEAKYAVRGELAIKSEKYREELEKGDSKLPFDTVISANIGNPQQLDQKPITFFRQVLSLLENPMLLEHPDVLIKSLGYKPDVIERAQSLLEDVKSVGAYSQSKGATGIRESVARFIERRDGFPADPELIHMSAGASGGVNTLMQIICAGSDSGVLVPIPQYPLYTATLALMNAKVVPYLLEESNQWGTDLTAIKEAHAKAKSEGVDVRAIVIINPGNPTGACLTSEEIKEVLEFAADEKLVVIADEVYQTNIFEGDFKSFRKSLHELQASGSGKYDDVELASLHSTSKGMVGECGHRGGYFELLGFDQEVLQQILKLISIQLCPPVIGQALVSLMVEPPTPGSPSYDLYKSEYDAIFNGLHKRAMALYSAFEKMEGVDCQKPAGSMYLFPTITLPKKALEEAKKQGKKPDEFYCDRMLDATGVCVVAGSGFGQKEGTLHFRTTFLAPGTEWTGRIVKFHEKFMDEFR